MNAKAIMAASILFGMAVGAGGAPALADVKAGVDAWAAGQYPSAVANWRPLALAGDADAQFNLAQAYKLGRGVTADLEQAEIWFRRAADQGHLQAEDNLGLVMFTAGKREAAMAYISRAAARGEPRAQYVLGTAHFNGDLAPRDPALAYALTKRASDAGLDVAAARLARLDLLVTLEERQRGLALLPEMERSAQRARLDAATGAVRPQPPQLSRRPEPVMATPAPSATPPPRAKASPPLPAPAPATGADWRAQLGAFSSAARGRAFWASLAKNTPALRSARQHLVTAGPVTRVQAGDFITRSDAEAFCALLRSQGQACIAVQK
mgnify:CR=1 FL=1